ncbi:two-component system sensor histidine kinase KdpD [Bogoriella caseilytica]|uniref:histidine kinase n=1 Tax=Bogoriella caseilytica TaxID=56055 RepID=A0A3N2BC10_9MICO|nr:two-component system sensor histidine kinase KdpD [Bogoriella caseilytica]
MVGIVAGLPIVTAGALVLREELALGSLLLVYLLLVVAIAAVGGFLPGVSAALLSFAAANLFLTQPYYTLHIDDRDTVLELVVFVVIAVIVSLVVEFASRERAAYRDRLAEQDAHARELATADAVRTSLLAAVGHDLRTPLAGIKAAASALRQRGVTWRPDQREALLETVEESADRLTRVVSDLLDMSRLQSGGHVTRRESVEVAALVAHTVAGHPRAAVRVDLPEGLPDVCGDAGFFERILDNLVDNARRFSPDESAVEITAAIAAEPAGGPGAQPRESGLVRLAVVDHGPGVPQQDWDRMFLPLQRLHDRSAGGHAGMGLAIARGLAEATGARVFPSPTPGGGLTMTLEMPVVQQ